MSRPQSDTSVALLAEVAARPLFPASEFDRLISDQNRDLDVIRAEPSALASDVFQRALYGGHPYGPVLPDVMGLEGLDLAAVQALYGRNVGPR